jgi:hypothetical protein
LGYAQYVQEILGIPVSERTFSLNALFCINSCLPLVTRCRDALTCECVGAKHCRKWSSEDQTCPSQQRVYLDVEASMHAVMWPLDACVHFGLFFLSDSHPEADKQNVYSLRHLPFATSFRASAESCVRLKKSLNQNHIRALESRISYGCKD